MSSVHESQEFQHSTILKHPVVICKPAYFTSIHVRMTTPIWTTLKLTPHQPFKPEPESDMYMTSIAKSTPPHCSGHVRCYY
jgi:hypothetical protein